MGEIEKKLKHGYTKLMLFKFLWYDCKSDEILGVVSKFFSNSKHHIWG